MQARSPGSPVAPVAPRAASRWGWDGLGRVLVGAAVVLVAVTLVVHVSPWVTKGFGVSHDGYNGAMWGLGGRGAVEAPVGNRLGGIQSTGAAYANHPPLLVWSTAAVGGATDDRPVALRTQALLASLAALALLVLLLRDAGCDPPAVAAAVVIAGTTGMFLTYGAMIDTPVVSLPLGLAALAAAQRAWQGRPPPPWALVATAALAALSGWQAALVAGLGAVACLVGPDRAGRRAGRLLAGGVAAGTTVTLAWILWSKGTLRDLGGQATLRAGEGTGWSSWLDRQVRFLGDLYGAPLLVLALVGLVVALVAPVPSDGDGPSGPRRGLGWIDLRPLGAVLVLAVVGYTVGLREASAVHDYWSFWGITLVAVAVAALVGGVQRVARGASRPVAVLLGGATTLLVVALALTGATRRSDADAVLREGLAAVPVLEAADRADPPGPDARPLVVRNASHTLAPWAEWATHRQAELPTAAELASLDGDRLLFIQTAGPPTPEVLSVALAHDGRFVLLRVDDYRTVVGG